MKIKYVLLLALSVLALPLHASQTGYASWYGGEFHGRKTANGEVFDTYKFTAAHRTLPFDTVLKVTNLENGKSTIVRVNDRGPFVDNRILDLSFAAAKEIGMIETGVTRVSIEVIEGNADSAAEYVYRIQVGAYSSMKNAENTVARLRSSGLRAEIEKTDAGIFRVVLKEIEEENLDRFRELLEKSGFRDYLLRKEIRL